MAWQEASIVEQRQEFVALASAENANIAGLCRRFGISRETGYKWIGRFKAGGKAALEDRPRRPRTSPEQTGPEAQAAVLHLRDAHPAWGGRKLRTRLRVLGHAGVPAPSTITGILRRHGRMDPAKSREHTAYTRFERARPNELWQMDFKGHVAMHVGGRCHPLTVLDDHSRYSIGLRACDNERARTVREHLVEMFRRYGLPEQMLTDNGAPWGVPQDRSRYTKLTVWMLRLGVRVIHGRPYHPQTQGKEERFHRTLKAELLSRQDLIDLPHAQGLFDGWRDVYNLERPSEALDMATPVTRYQPSERVYPEQLPEIELSPDDQARLVKRDGALSWAGRWWYVGQGFAGERVGVRVVDAGLEVRYGPYLIDTIPASDSAPQRLTSRHRPTPLAALAPSADGGTAAQCQ